MATPMPDRLVAHIRPDGVLVFPENDGPTNYRWFLRLEVVATPGEGVGRHDLFDIAREIERRWTTAPDAGIVLAPELVEFVKFAYRGIDTNVRERAAELLARLAVNP